MKKILYTVSFLLSTGLGVMNTKAQSGMSEFIKSGLDDGNKLINAYSSPLLKSFGAGLNSGWYNTGKVHGLGGFDLTVTPTLIFIPNEDLKFDVNNLGLQHIQHISGPTETSTAFGSQNSSTVVGVRGKSPFTNQDTTLQTFNMPGGLGVALSTVPTAHLAVGVGFGTELAVRFVPQITIDKIKVGMFGFGIKHDFKRWIPGMKELPFDLSAMFSYTTLNAELALDEVKGDPQSTMTYNPNSGKSYKQTAEFNANAYSFNVILSKKLAFFTPYLGVGYQASTTTMKMMGEYPITTFNPNYSPLATPGTQNAYPKYVFEVKDPISVEGKLSGMRANLGFRLKFGPITFHTDYTLAQYKVLSLGLGVNIQSLAPFKL